MLNSVMNLQAVELLHLEAAYQINIFLLVTNIKVAEKAFDYIRIEQDFVVLQVWQNWSVLVI